MNVQIINNRKFFLISVNLISTEITAESKKKQTVWLVVPVSSQVVSTWVYVQSIPDKLP